MKSLISVLRLQVLVVAVAICVAAAGVFSSFFGRYHATLALGLNDPVIFSDIEHDLRSTDFLARLAQARGLASSPEAQAFESELASGASAPLTITYAFLVTRASLRDVPDTVSTKLSQNADRSDVVVSAAARTPDRAVKLAKLGVAFVRSVLVRHALSDEIHAWQNARDSIARLDTNLLQIKTAIASIDRTIAQMTKLQSNDAQNSDAQGSAGASAGNAIQIQVYGASYLPLRQQIIGLQSKKNDNVEALQATEDEKTRVETLQAFGTELASVLAAQSDPLKVLDVALARAETLRAQSTVIPEQSAYDDAISRLALAEKKYVDLQTKPPEPYVYQSGFGLASSAVIGGVLGILLWMGFLYCLHLWEAEQTASRHEAISTNVIPVGTSESLEPRRVRAASIDHDR
jgi:hypothetical protein